MRKFLYTAVLAGFLSIAWTLPGATPAKRKSTHASRTATAKGSKKSAAPKTTWRNRQLAPTPERYKQIQNALAAKGYLDPSQANGAWGQSSTDALKRFQADQNLEATGKLNSLSLIALGLGPKRDTAAITPPGAPQAQNR